MSNSYSSSLLTQKLEEAVTTVLSDALAPLSVFTRQFGVDAFKPRATVQLKLTTAGSTTQKNATNFETGDGTVTNIPIVVDQYSQPFHVENDELNSGLRLQDLSEQNARKFGESISDVVLALLTTANFATAVTRAPAAFSFSDMSQAWGALKKSTVKNAILDGDYLARVINNPGFFQRTGTGGGGGFEAFGWDSLHSLSRWGAAESDTRGFFCNPQAIGIVAGVPLVVPNPTMQTKIVTLPGLELSVALNTWMRLSSRTMWASFDVMFGASALDTTAGFLLKSA